MSTNLVCTKHFIISFDIMSLPTAFPFFNFLAALIISLFRISSSNKLFGRVKSLTLVIIFWIVLSKLSGMFGALFNCLNHSYHSSGSILSVMLQFFLFLNLFTISQKPSGCVDSSWLIFCSISSLILCSVYLISCLYSFFILWYLPLTIGSLGYLFKFFKATVNSFFCLFTIFIKPFFISTHIRV